MGGKHWGLDTAVWTVPLDSETRQLDTESDDRSTLRKLLSMIVEICLASESARFYQSTEGQPPGVNDWLYSRSPARRTTWAVAFRGRSESLPIGIFIFILIFIFKNATGCSAGAYDMLGRKIFDPGHMIDAPKRMLPPSNCQAIELAGAVKYFSQLGLSSSATPILKTELFTCTR
ncbi:hypothetical protein C8J56DRAFT_897109 [Mycena floridula]|nr:hypothetical protein C8J56DRAFT_897109 [Mycena floridula]